MYLAPQPFCACAMHSLYLSLFCSSSKVPWRFGHSTTTRQADCQDKSSYMYDRRRSRCFCTKVGCGWPRWYTRLSPCGLLHCGICSLFKTLLTNTNQWKHHQLVDFFCNISRWLDGFQTWHSGYRDHWHHVKTQPLIFTLNSLSLPSPTFQSHTCL